MKFKITISLYIFCFLFGAESPANVSNDNGFNYTGKNNGNALVKFTNPEYAFDEVSDKNGKAYKNLILVTLVLFQQLVLLIYHPVQHLSRLTHQRVILFRFLTDHQE